MVFWQNRSGDRWGCCVEASSGGAGLLRQQALHPDQMADLALGTKHRSRSGQGGRRRGDRLGRGRGLGRAARQ